MKKGVTLSTLWSRLTEEEPDDLMSDGMSDARFTINFTLALVSTVLAPKIYLRVNLDILGDIIPVERINTLDWNGFILEQLAAGAGAGQGCFYLLHVSLFCT
jgi:hypothetical protein